MYRIAIFAALLLSAKPGWGAEFYVSTGEVEQPAQGQRSAQDGPVPAPETGAAQPESKTEATPPGQQAEAPVSEKPNGADRKTATHKRHRQSRKSTQAPTNGETRKVVIHHGGVTEPVTQIVPGITPEEAIRQREGAEQLLASSKGLLETLAVRPLNLKQQGMVVQIRQYIDVATSALKESDTQRAHTLALKAYLLADDLVKH